MGARRQVELWVDVDLGHLRDEDVIPRSVPVRLANDDFEAEARAFDVGQAGAKAVSSSQDASLVQDGARADKLKAARSSHSEYLHLPRVLVLAVTPVLFRFQVALAAIAVVVGLDIRLTGEEAVPVSGSAWRMPDRHDRPLVGVQVARDDLAALANGLRSRGLSVALEIDADSVVSAGESGEAVASEGCVAAVADLVPGELDLRGARRRVRLV